MWTSHENTEIKEVWPHVRGVTVVVWEFKQVIWAALLIRERALDFWLQHVLSNLVPAVHALQVLLTPTLLCKSRIPYFRNVSPVSLMFKCWMNELTWVLNEVGLHEVVQDVVLTDPLHWAAACGTERRTLHPAWVAGSTEDVHARLQAEAESHSFLSSIHWKQNKGDKPDAVVQEILTNHTCQALLHLVRLGSIHWWFSHMIPHTGPHRTDFCCSGRVWQVWTVIFICQHKYHTSWHPVTGRLFYTSVPYHPQFSSSYFLAPCPLFPALVECH